MLFIKKAKNRLLQLPELVLRFTFYNTKNIFLIAFIIVLEIKLNTQIENSL